MITKPNTAQADSTSHAFLTGAILFVNIDYSGLAAYALKAAIGGIIWMVFKLAGDFLSDKMLNRKKNKKTENQPEGTEE